VTNAQEVIVKELEELGLFKLNTRDNLVQDVVCVAFRVACNYADGFLKNFKRNGNLDQVLDNLQNYDF
jgi:predicted transcriptional regulator YheO